MQRDALSEMLAFVQVARERSFTRAAAKMGVSQSALSQTVKKLEEQLGVQLLVRTTRNVAPTEIGESLLSKVSPYFDGIEKELTAVNEQRSKPAGTIRISCSDHAINELLLLRLGDFLNTYPDVNLELMIDYGLVDIISQGFHAGIRYGENIAKDMIAVKIGPDARMIAIGSPDYFARHAPPETPRDLSDHNCIGLRQNSGRVYAWELQRRNEAEIKVLVTGQLMFNGIYPCLNAAREGLGLAFVPEDLAAPYLANGSLKIALDEWSIPFPGYYLYYPTITQPPPAFTLLVEVLRHKWDAA